MQGAQPTNQESNLLPVLDTSLLIPYQILVLSSFAIGRIATHCCFVIQNINRCSVLSNTLDEILFFFILNGPVNAIYY